MKIAYCGLGLTPGKIKYNDPILNELEKKFKPKKFTPYFFELCENEFEKCEATVIAREKMLDLLVLDLEKLEARLERSEDDKEKAVAKKCIAELEKEIPLCDVPFSPEEVEILKVLSLVSFKGTVVMDNTPDDINPLLEKAMLKAGSVFFYTAGKQEVRSWIVKKDSDIVTCAGKIHTDLARGFIKADVIHFDEFKNFHNFNDAREKGAMRLEDKNYIIKYGDIIEIRFNV